MKEKFITKMEKFIVKEKFITKRNSSLFLRITRSLTKMSLEEKSTVSITTFGIIVLILVGVAGMLSKTRSTIKSR